jgi:NADH:ubiquinone oxidoreductase subunit 3 (subunit A)
VGFTVEAWGHALAFIGLATIFILGMVAASRIFEVRPKYTSTIRHDTYECGEEPDGTAWLKFHPRYFVVGLVFVLFDVEAAFLIPWSLNIQELGGLALVDMAIFLGVLFLGWIYALRKGALTWQ